MADKDKSGGSVDDIEEQIRKLEKEKEELERLNERRRLEQRLQLLQDDVSGLKSKEGPSSRDNRMSSGGAQSRGRDSGDLNTSLEDSQARLRSLQQNILNSSLGGASSVAEDTPEDHQRYSDEADELDDVMSTKHKQALRINRDVLVENMTPDDIFNDLISKHILSNSDVSRIKEKNTIEAINEELLNVLIRRSDKAFHVFVSSLRRTLQGWLANRLDPGSQPSSKRKRRTGEINLNVDCERVVPARNKRLTCTCQEVEEQILLMAKGAFAHIRRRDASPAAFEQFKKELQQTNLVIKESMEIRNTMKELCRHGDLVDLSEGSVCFTIRCASLASCQELWDMCHSGRLLAIFQENLVSPFLLRTCGAREIRLCLRISRLEFLTCALELAYQERNSMLNDMEFDKATPIKRRLRKQKSRASENDKGSSAQKDRQAFKEISNNYSSRSSPSSDEIPVRQDDITAHDSGYTHISPVNSSLENLPTASFTEFSNVLARKEVISLKSYKQLCRHSSITRTSLCRHRSQNEVKPRVKRLANQAQLTDSSVWLSEQSCFCPYNLRYRIIDT